VMRRLTGFNFHRGCLAIADRPAPLAVETLLDQARCVLVLEELSDADNVGGVFRNAAAFGVDAVVLSPGCCDPLYRKATRTSMGATLRVPFARMPKWPDGLHAFDDAGMTLVALTPREPALTLDEWAGALPNRPAIMLGTEGAGLSAGAERMAASRVRIPIASGVDSLNVSVAAGIALSRLTGRDVLR
jgi:tRNA G18 (ribose-2'-O)-methylase SpoU